MMERLIKHTLVLALILTPAVMVAQAAPAPPVVPVTPAAPASPAAPGASAAQGVAVDGTWQITGDVAGNPVVSTCILTTAEGKIAGTCTGVDGATVPVTGAVTDAGVKWSYESTYNGEKIVLTYTAKLIPDGTLSGTIYVDPFAVDGGFTATRKVAS
jgi:hypothetical protein